MGVRDDLEAADLLAVLGLLQQVNAVEGIDEFADAVVDGIRSVIPADMVTYNEVDPRSDRIVARASPPERGVLPWQAERWQRWAHQHPLYQHQVRTGDRSAMRISDLVEPERFHRLELYTELFAQMGVEHQLAAGLPTAAPLIVAIVLSRCERDFSDRDVAVLDLLRPHLQQSYAHLQLRSRLVGQLETLDGVLAVAGWGAARVVGGRLEPLTAASADWIESYAAASALEGWWAERRADGALRSPASWSCRRGDRRLTARSVDDPSGTTILLLDERAVDVDPAPALALGLTAREAEVLVRVADGRTNAQIAADLGVSASAVKRHLERSYRKLGVDNRTAAAARVHEVVAGWG